MTYLILQMLFCLIVAFILGLIIGYLLCKICKKCSNGNCQKRNKEVKQSPAAMAAAGISSLVSDDDDAVINLDSNVNLDGDDYEIQTLEGIGPQTGDLFRGYGIATVGDFLRKLHTPASRENAAKDLNILVDPIHKWASMSDLLRIEGIDHQFAELVTAVNVKTTFDLSHSDANTLTAKMEEANNAGAQLIAPTTPTTDQVASWIAQAKNIATVVTV